MDVKRQQQKILLKGFAGTYVKFLAKKTCALVRVWLKLQALINSTICG
jgi:hypothetical protein